MASKYQNIYDTVERKHSEDWGKTWPTNVEETKSNIFF